MSKRTYQPSKRTRKNQFGFPRPHGHQGRPRHPAPPSPERPQAPDSQGCRDSNTAATPRSTTEFAALAPLREPPHPPAMRLPRKCSMTEPRGIRAGQNHRSGESRPVRHFEHLGRSRAGIAAHRLHHHQAQWQGARPQPAAPQVPHSGPAAMPQFPEMRRFLVTIARPGAAQADLRRARGRLAPPGPPPRITSPAPNPSRDLANPQRRHPGDDPFLSADPQSDAQIHRRSRCRLPLLAHLLELFSSGGGDPRAPPRVVAWNLPDFPLSSMGGQWL
jgi:hypothetical protein